MDDETYWYAETARYPFLGGVNFSRPPLVLMVIDGLAYIEPAKECSQETKTTE